MRHTSLTFADADETTDLRSGSLENPAVPLSSTTIIGASNSSSVSTSIHVTPYKALGYAPFYQAISAMSGDCAKMPLNVLRKTTVGREIVDSHSAQSKIHLSGAANPELNAYKFWRRYFTSAMMHNNAYAWIDRTESGEILGLYNLLPDRTAPVRYKGELYFLTEVGRKLEAIPANEILHIEGISIDNMAGAEFIKLFREDFEKELARRKFLSKFFRSNMTSGGFLAVPPNAKPEAVRKVKAKIDDKFDSESDSAFKTTVLRDGYKWFGTQVTPDNAQMSEMDADGARNVARMFNLHPSRLGVPGSQSYNTLEMAQRDYYDGALSHWLISNKCECNLKLLTDEERATKHYIDYNINALLWADAQTRSQIAIAGIQHGRFSPRETREWENMNAYEGSEIFYRPLNLEPIGAKPADNSNSDANRGKHASAAMRKLLADTFQRATNRVGIKAERNKNYRDEALSDDRETLISMLEPALSVALESVNEIGTDARTIATNWITAWTAKDVREGGDLKSTAEAAAIETMKTLLGVPKE